nr:MAG TPA_asm: hypothetical protein [Caudoviricetes sp.]
MGTITRMAHAHKISRPPSSIDVCHFYLHRHNQMARQFVYFQYCHAAHLVAR